MPQYQISGLNAEGKREVLKVEAESVVEAVFSVISEGYSEVTALTDDFVRAVDQLPTTSNAGENEDSEGADGVRPQDMSKLGRFCYSLKQSFTKHWLSYLLIYGVFGYRLMQGNVFRTGYSSYLWWMLGWMWDLFLILLMAIPFLGAFLYSLIGAGDVYAMMLLDSSWNRWNEAWALLPQLKGKIPDFEYAIRKGIILSGLERFEEAVESVERFRNDPDVPKWMYHSRFTDICYPAGKVDLILENSEHAFQLAPEMDAVRIDYAMVLLRFRRDAVLGKEVLSPIQEEGLAELAKPFLWTVQGLIALEEKRATEAVKQFEKALVVLEKYVPTNPPVGSTRDVTHGYLCLAYAQEGNLEEARRHFEMAERRLRIFKLDDILKRCEAALAGGGS